MAVAREGPGLLAGQSAQTRHFLVDAAVYRRARARAAKEGVRLSRVIRAGLAEYAAEAPDHGRRGKARYLSTLPAAAVDGLREVWGTEVANDYLAALHRAGWSLRAIAEGLVEAGVARMSRQAVALRAARAAAEPPEGLPEVPVCGPQRARRPRRGRARKPGQHDVAFRVADRDYDPAARRAAHEGAMLSVIVEETLARFATGELVVAAAGKATPARVGHRDGGSVAGGRRQEGTGD